MPRCIQFNVEQFKSYSSDTSYILQQGFASVGYVPYGKRFPGSQNCLDVKKVCQAVKPDIVFFQEKNTWDPSMPQPPTKDVGFVNFKWLGQQPNILRVTQFADPCSHQAEHKRWHDELQPQVILVRYELGNALAYNRWLPRSKLLRIYHSVTPKYCLPVIGGRSRSKVAILAGARGHRVYPLRTRLYKQIADDKSTGDVFTLRGYHGHKRVGGSAVPAFMRALSQHRVAVVATSAYHWALKKHFEATAAGCIVVTNLSASERVPIIEENLVRIPDNITVRALRDLVSHLAAGWSLGKQRDLSERCIARYDYRVEAKRIHQILAQKERA